MLKVFSSHGDRRGNLKSDIFRDFLFFHTFTETGNQRSCLCTFLKTLFKIITGKRTFCSKRSFGSRPTYKAFRMLRFDRVLVYSTRTRYFIMVMVEGEQINFIFRSTQFQVNITTRIVLIMSVELYGKKT